MSRQIPFPRPLPVNLRACLWFGLFLSWGWATTALAFDRPNLVFSPRTYVCARATGAITLDGRLDDPAWQAAPWTETFVDIEGPSKPDPALTTTVRMLYDDRYFYVAAWMEEPHVRATVTERDAVIYQDNDFEVFIDPDGDNHLYYELEINALGTEWDLLLNRPYRDGGPAINAWDIQGLRTAVAVDGTLNDSSDLDRGWSVEMAIPWEVLAQAAGRPTPPLPGDIWRVNFSRVQWTVTAEGQGYEKVLDEATGRPLPENNWVWSPQGLVAMHYPEMWGEVLFAGDQATSVEDTPEHLEISAAFTLMLLYYSQRDWMEDHGRFASSLGELRFPAEHLPEGWLMTLDTCGAGFVATLVSPHGTATVDQDGRLERKP